MAPKLGSSRVCVGREKILIEWVAIIIMENIFNKLRINVHLLQQIMK
jgi:hypothetical protein